MGWVYNVTEADATLYSPIIALGTVLILLSCIILVFYLGRKLLLGSALKKEDFNTIATWVSTFVFSLLNIIATRWGLGLSLVDNMPLDNWAHLGKLQYTAGVFYISSLLGFKLSILLTFQNLAIFHLRRTIIKLLIATCIISHVIFLGLHLFGCNPIAAQWQQETSSKSCLHPLPVYVTISTVTILLDMVLLVISFLLFKDIAFELPTPNHKRITISILFLLGLGINILQPLQIKYFLLAANVLNNSPIIILQILEINLGTILSALLLLVTSSQPKIPLTNKPTSIDAMAPTQTRLRSLRTGFISNERLQYLLPLVHFGRKRLIEKEPENERSASRFEDIDGSKSDLESLDFDMTIIKTTEVIVCREG